MHQHPLGAILGGGRSRRFGPPKALAEVQGETIASRVRGAVGDVLTDLVVITDQPEVFADLRLPSRPDQIPGMGAIGGIHAALRWAQELGLPGALCVPCDMPFLSAPLLRRLCDIAAGSSADVSAPESNGPHGIEPLCAVYSVSSLPEVERRLALGERALSGLLNAVHTRRLPLNEVRRFGDPDVLFLNVNTPEEHRRAVQIASATTESHERN
jgi:molybdopterin-guanine dinucleotide biosynthesis protein A